MTKEPAVLWFVIDEENCTSYDENTDGSEVFLSDKLATARALEMAAQSPGARFHVCRTTSFAFAQVGEPKIVELA